MLLTTKVRLNRYGRRIRSHRYTVGFSVLAASIVTLSRWPQLLLIFIVPGELLTLFLTNGLGMIAQLALVARKTLEIFLAVATYMLIPYAALALAEGRKIPLLYLRRFGLPSSHRMMTNVIESGLSRRYRVLTLDDNDFGAPEVPPFERRLTWLGFPVASFSAVVVSLSVFSLYRNGTDTLAGALGFGLTFGFFIARYYGEFTNGLIWWTIFITAVLIIHRRRVKMNAAPKVRNSADLNALSELVSKLGGWLRAPAFMAPQATIATVSEPLWRETVMRLQALMPVIVTDVSVPAPSLLWEIEQLSKRNYCSTIFVGQEELVQHWMTGSSCTEADLRLRQLLNGQTILIYSEQGRGSSRTFRNNLLAALDNIAGLVAMEEQSRRLNFSQLYPKRKVFWRRATANRRALRNLAQKIWKPVLTYYFIFMASAYATLVFRTLIVRILQYL